ncbi:MAG: Ig-like domain-containing protein, partial [Flaviramulus sp.]|nr:Ig-like domain-containing protein [Flaviramulus sp.]
MRKKYNCISSVITTKTLLVLFFVILTNSLLAQTQAPSIQTGVTFQWSPNPQAGNAGPAVIESITIDGTIYNTFVIPNDYELTRLGPDGHEPNEIRENGVLIATASNVPNWDALALSAFQDKNLNHYFTANPNGQNICNNFNAIATTNAQKQTIFYNPAIPSNQDGVLAVTERGGNNCFYIEVWGIPVGGGVEQKLGETFVRNSGNYTGSIPGVPVAGSDYWRSGRVNENGQTIAVALFYLNELAPTGSNITKIEFVGASRDHGDGKFFLLQKYAVDQQDFNCVDEAHNGDLSINNNVPINSTYSLVSGPTPSSGVQAFNLNSDGTFNFTPANGFVGDVTFDYEVCLPAPNTSVCDQATVTLTVVDLPTDPVIDIECGTTSNSFNIKVTSPLGNNFQYSIDNGLTYQYSPDFLNLAEGLYNLLVKNDSGNCATSYSGNSIVLDALELSGNVSNAICSSGNDGSIDISVSGGFSPYSFLWSNGATTEDITGLSSGNYSVTVTDNNGCTITNDFDVVVDVDNIPPTFTAPVDIEIFTDATCNYNVDVAITGDVIDETDNCDTILDATYSDNLVSGPCNGSYILSRTWSLLDTSGNSAADQVQTITITDNTPPIINTPSSDLTVECDGDNSADLIAWLNSNGGATATDACSSITWSNDFSNLNLTCGATGSGLVAFTATDECGNSVSTSATFTVVDNTPPTFTAPADIEIFTDATCNYDVDVAFTGDVINENDGCSSGIQATFIDSAPVTGSCQGSFVISRTWSLTDACGNSAADQVQTITITDNTPPIIDTPSSDLTVECDGDNSADLIAWLNSNGGATATDACSSITWSNDFSNLNLTCGATGSGLVAFTATDECGNSVSTSATFTVVDNTPPTFTAPADIEIFTDATCNYDVDVAFTGDVINENDGCSSGIQATFIDSAPVTGSCQGSFVISRTWSLTDACGNSAADQVQTITITDNTPPIIDNTNI